MRNNFKKHFIAILLLPLLVVGCADEGSTGAPGQGGVSDTGLFISISAGAGHTCGIDTSQSAGTLKCWGSNFYGQLGDGSQTDRLLPSAINTATVYSQVSTGADHTCAITWSNVLKCWGHNNFGQLGIGNTTDMSAPVTVDAGTNYIYVSVGGNTSCAIASGGQLKCWGYNGYGSIGDNTTVNRSVPTDVNVGTLYKTVSTSGNTTCGITSADGLKCWGNNQYGQIGDGTTVNKAAPLVIDGSETYKKISTSPVASFFTCGLTTAGKIKCWGENQYGQLGDGTTSTRSLPVAISAAKTYTDISTGYVHTCAVEALTAQLTCWGKNEYGQLGDYTTTTHTSAVVGDTSKLYSSISLGYNYTCGRTNKNLLRCWGRNDFGQVGDGSMFDVLYPKSIK